MRTYSFNDIAGFEQEKDELMRLCEIFKNRKKYEQKGAKLPKGIIFYGDSGNGKTLFSKVLASECNLNTVSIDVGKTESEKDICKSIRKSFMQATKRKEPTMIFFDELDKVLPNAREEYFTDRSKTILTQLLTLIDGMESLENVVFVATCNDYDCLPETIVRPGRIDKKIFIPNPTYDSRLKILKLYAEKSPCRFETSLEDIARFSTGYSSAALETLINECVLHSDENNFVSDEVVKKVFVEIKKEDIPRRPSPFGEKLFAIRNLGSFVVARSLNDDDYILSTEGNTVCNFFFNGICAEFDSDYSASNDIEEWRDDDCDDEYDDDYYDDDDDKKGNDSNFYSKKDYLNTICVLLGGYVAEELVLHKIYDNVKYHLSLVDDILFRMSENGMLGLLLRYEQNRNDEMIYSESRIEKINNAMDEIVESCYQKAKEVVASNVELIKKLAPMLAEKGSIDKKTIEPILNEMGGIKNEKN